MTKERVRLRCGRPFEVKHKPVSSLQLTEHGGPSVVGGVCNVIRTSNADQLNCQGTRMFTKVALSTELTGIPDVHESGKVALRGSMGGK
jgi:hypothetical protein